MNVISTINQILQVEFEIEANLLEQHADLYEDIELDSLDAVDLVVSLEKNFSIKVNEDEMRKIRTLSELYLMVESLQESSAPV